MSSTHLPLTARAKAHANIALAKYWGKSPLGDNLTAVPSLSLTLDALETRTEVCFDPSLQLDELHLNDQVITGRGLERVTALLNRVRTLSGVHHFARVESENNFPTAAGLASSASGFAALAVAALAASRNLKTTWEASRLARQSSASAARSVFGGFVELEKEAEAANTIAPGSHWDLVMLVGVVEAGEKPVSSTLGMEHTRATSPFYQSWVNSAPRTFETVKEALMRRDFAELAAAMEHSTLAMHATMSSAVPPVLYMRGPSIELIHAIRARREAGYPEAFTMDAGPNVKLLTVREHLTKARAFLESFPGISSVIVAEAGPDASLLEQDGPLRNARPLASPSLASPPAP
jgi:diphosphomevalonate decarboxylase